MLRALACVLSFAATCLAAPALADKLGAVLAPGIAAAAGYLGTRLLLTGAMASAGDGDPRQAGRDTTRRGSGAAPPHVQLYVR